MNTYMPILETDLLYIKPFSITTDNLAFQEPAFLHDSSWSLLSTIDNDGCDDKKERSQQKHKEITHDYIYICL